MKLNAGEKYMTESDIVDEFRKGCLMLKGELTESKNLVKCDFEEAKVTLKKDGEWIKYYYEGKLRVWCRAEKVTVAESFGWTLMNIDFRDCDIQGITLGINPSGTLMYISPPIEEPHVAEEFLKEYAEKTRRAFIASRSRIGRRR